ncbi:MAG TPA: hypothetical protein VFW53_05910, partial [Gallionella sp.]|nr:hypothetical protein [Gallionella sp.]
AGQARGKGKLKRLQGGKRVIGHKQELEISEVGDYSVKPRCQRGSHMPQADPHSNLTILTQTSTL